MLHLLMVFLVCLAFACNPKTSSQSISYESDSFIFTQHKSLKVITPKSNAAITACKTTPALPQGINLSAACVISGKASLPTSAQNFTITATIGEREASTTLSLEVLSAIKTITAGSSSIYALLEDGKLWAWGSNNSGRLGDGTTDTSRDASSNSPVQVKDLMGVQAIAAGSSSAYALLTDGTVWAWGLDGAGQLGDGRTDTESNIPVQVKNLTNVKMISGGDGVAYALLANGSIWGWGIDSKGQLCGMTAATGKYYSDHPIQINHLQNVQAIAAGSSSAYVLLADGTVWAWGKNSLGQLGDGTSRSSNNPVQVKDLTGVQAIAAGSSSAYALLTDGTVWAWGYNENGELGDGATSGSSNTPVQVKNLTGVQTITASSYSAYALLTDGTVWAWGSNSEGQLGNGTKTASSTPVQVIFDWEKIFADAAQ